MTDVTNDWDAGSYDSFRRLRLRPAADLLAQLAHIPAGEIVDLGCGSGAAAQQLRARFPNHRLTGVDQSQSMLQQAATLNLYDQIIEADIELWSPSAPLALIFTNAVLHWLPDHESLFARLLSLLAPGGTLAVQMPRQLGRPSHDLIYQTAHTLFPDCFDGIVPVQVATPQVLHPILVRHGDVSIWETEYMQHLRASDQGHPVRMFTQSTAARPVLTQLTAKQRAAFLQHYDAALLGPYPLASDGSVLMPFRRQFAVVTLAKE